MRGSWPLKILKLPHRGVGNCSTALNTLVADFKTGSILFSIPSKCVNVLFFTLPIFRRGRLISKIWPTIAASGTILCLCRPKTVITSILIAAGLESPCDKGQSSTIIARIINYGDGSYEQYLYSFVIEWANKKHCLILISFWEVHD